MNKQKSKTGRGIEWTDYTWNPIAGCFHACQWSMPDGTIANCYAEDVAEKVAASAYPHGFEHHYWNPNQLTAPMSVKTPSKIFVGSMADVFGHWTPDEQVQQVIDVCSAVHWHTFQFLTKNPLRAAKFNLPLNCWIGASTPPDFMWNKPLNHKQKTSMLLKTMRALSEVRQNGNITWMSAEPLSWDVAYDLLEFEEQIIELGGDVENFIDWIVIGAASSGKKYFAPNAEHFTELMEYCEVRDIKVFFKGNLKSLSQAAASWREEFPEPRKAQMGMF